MNLPPLEAFRIFTDEVDLWWRHGPHFRFRRGRDPKADGVMRFEPGVGGRLVEVYDEAGTEHEVGRIEIWEPGARLVFGWRSRNYKEGERTEVEVLFAPAGDGTRVTVEHCGFDALPAGHPARDGLEGPAFAAMMGTWWADQLNAMRPQPGRT